MLHKGINDNNYQQHGGAFMEKTKELEKLGSSATEAWAENDKEIKDTKVTIPSEEAVQEAKEWVEENEK
jgi:hypothetical protein